MKQKPSVRKCKKCKKELQQRIRKYTTGYCKICYLKISPPALGKLKEDNPYVGYTALHAWVYKRRGKAIKCEFCGKSKLRGYKINWANIDHRYRRVLSDWIQLCAKCHSQYDRKRPNVMYSSSKK